MKFRVFAGLGGGFGGADDRGVHEFVDEEYASLWAWELACETYDSYGGMHGLETVESIMEEEGLDEEDALQQLNDNRESWLDFYVEEVKEESTPQWVTSK